MANLLPHEGYY
ncbi:hypothetical protein JCM5350_000477, partial [Sporobolomyces pararoseus]